MLDASALLAVEEPQDGSPLPDERAREAVFDVLARVRSLPVMGQVLSPHSNPMWKITPSSQALRTLRSFWLRRSLEGSLEHDFTDAARDTRFLQDLYAALDEQAAKSYGLVATPDFVVVMILDLTVVPAVAGRRPRIRRTGGDRQLALPVDLAVGERGGVEDDIASPTASATGNGELVRLRLEVTEASRKRSPKVVRVPHCP